MRMDSQWEEVLARSVTAGFVYAVRSTGIFCRPRCPSKRPGRAQVRFFDTAQDAQAEGFRACKRCRPLEAEAPWFERLCRRLSETEEAVSVASLAREAGMSERALRAAFKARLGVSPRAYRQAARIAKLKRGLREGHDVTRALYDAGYGSSSRLYESARERLGMTPGLYARGGRGRRIRYTVVPSKLGRLLVAGTDDGVCAVHLGEREGDLESNFRSEFFAAELRRDDAGLRDWTQRIRSSVDGAPEGVQVPLDVRATAFQAQVWQELARIPRGQVRSYSQVANALGRPKATRAVASACASNPVAIVVPCHRVVRTDGGLGGYRWGISRKRALLAQERTELDWPRS